MNLFQRLFQFSVSQSAQAPDSAEQVVSFFDPADRIRESLSRTTQQCVVCGRPFSEHRDVFGDFHACVGRPVRHAL